LEKRSLTGSSVERLRADQTGTTVTPNRSTALTGRRCLCARRWRTAVEQRGKVGDKHDRYESYDEHDHDHSKVVLSSRLHIDSPVGRSAAPGSSGTILGSRRISVSHSVGTSRPPGRRVGRPTSKSNPTDIGSGTPRSHIDGGGIRHTKRCALVPSGNSTLRTRSITTAPTRR